MGADERHSPVPVVDALMAATARVNGLTLVTRMPRTCVAWG